MMRRIALPKAALLIILMSYGIGCATDRAAEPDAVAEPDAAAVVNTAAEVDTVTALYRKGNEAFEAMDLEQALSYYDQALSFDSSYAEAYLGRGRIFWFTLQFQSAVDDLNRALYIDNPSRLSPFPKVDMSGINR